MANNLLEIAIERITKVRDDFETDATWFNGLNTAILISQQVLAEHLVKQDEIIQLKIDNEKLQNKLFSKKL